MFKFARNKVTVGSYVVLFLNSSSVFALNSRSFDKVGAKTVFRFQVRFYQLKFKLRLTKCLKKVNRILIKKAAMINVPF